MIYVLVVLALVAVALSAAVLRRRRRDPLARRYAAFAQHRGWQRVRPDEALTLLEPFACYLADAATVLQAHAGPLGTGRGLVVALGSRRPAAQERPWFLAVALNDAFADAPSIDLDPRAVRTVRVVDQVRELQLPEERIQRGWRVTAPEDDAATWLSDRRRLHDLADVLHRPHPWVFGVRVRPGGVAVHLARREEHPGDVDDLERMTALVGRLAAALDVTPVV